ncbi:hypothetical protein Pcinc_040904 [Petrolisthes cinctipes]|uniref:Uncharacterized protein n=1 Tax=Petrolisthes cinctipes TaxID=88211 RepID=A0AAE1BKY6_PETCI|nr:hypothetical protein Pcinc_040904 [Petrolisthes cinctipes]
MDNNNNNNTMDNNNTTTTINNNNTITTTNNNNTITTTNNNNNTTNNTTNNNTTTTTTNNTTITNNTMDNNNTNHFSTVPNVQTPTQSSNPNNNNATWLSAGEGEGPRVIVVLVGSGDMTRGLLLCLNRAGYRPVIASRNPGRTRTWLSGGGGEFDVAGVEEGITMGDLIVLAIPSQYHHTLPTHLLDNKVVIDISNRSPNIPSGGPSLAEQLQEKLPRSYVIKAFNTVSAYVLQRGDLHRGREVPICGNEVRARAKVCQLVKGMGLEAVDMGALINARHIESIPLSFFPTWKIPLIVSTLAFLFFWLTTIFHNQICPNIERENNQDWDWTRFITVPLNNTQICLGYTACLLLIVCYFPGIIASYLQLWRGTKYSHFPAWLDTWLKIRKEIGLLALMLGSTHGCLAIFTKMSYGMDDEWWQQVYILCGGLLEMVLVILGITSLPSVSTKLTWREFSVLQRYLGWSSVVLVTAHMVVSNVNFILGPLRCVVIPSGAQMLTPLCFLTLLLKLPLLLPCLDSHLTKIRAGYERQPTSHKTTPPAV